MTIPTPTDPTADLLAAGRRVLAQRRVTDLTRPRIPSTPSTPKDTPVSHADAPTDPIPADDAPHAYVALRRTHSPHADRPEWGQDAAVIPEWNADDINFARSQGYTLLPIGPDGDTGTRAITEEGDLAARVIALQAAVDSKAGWRPPAREITTAAEADALPVGTILFHVACPDPDPCIWRRACGASEEDELGGTFDHIHWEAWGDMETRYDSEDLECHADSGGPLLAVYVPTEEAESRG